MPFPVHAHLTVSGVIALATFVPAVRSGERADTQPVAPAWNAAAAEHLLNRAGFGARPDEIREAVALGREELIERLLTGPKSEPEPVLHGQFALPHRMQVPSAVHADLERRRERYLESHVSGYCTLQDFGDRWVQDMLDGTDPLRDRMTLFWHGHFACSIMEVKDANEMVRQIRFLRAHALEPFEGMLRGMARDPAMLEYLDNATNVKGHPNENWARELMELFSLGEGNYSEKDIREAARAFTGWSDEESEFLFRRTEHDFGQKTVLGVTGNLDGDQIIDIILREPACGDWLAGKIIHYLEGRFPTPERHQDYARYLREHDYDIGKLLRRLFADPEFYRPEVLGQRVSGPIDFLVGGARRTGARPPGQMILAAADLLGQRLFWPPSVKGWDRGPAWITTTTMMTRSNLAGTMLNLVSLDELLLDEEFGLEMDSTTGKKKRSRARAGSYVLLTSIQRSGWTSASSFAALSSELGLKADDERIADCLLDELLPVSCPPSTRGEAIAFLAALRRARDVQAEALFEDQEKAELILREFAHFILSLPEAQLN